MQARSPKCDSSLLQKFIIFELEKHEIVLSCRRDAYFRDVHIFNKNCFLLCRFCEISIFPWFFNDFFQPSGPKSGPGTVWVASLGGLGGRSESWGGLGRSWGGSRKVLGGSRESLEVVLGRAWSFGPTLLGL